MYRDRTKPGARTATAATRYARLANTEYDQSEVASLTALVVGVGAVGGEVVKHLALMGVGTILAIDADVFEESNLGRSVLFASAPPGVRRAGATKVDLAQRAVARWNPEARLVPLCARVEDVGLGPFLAADLVFSCVDTAAARVFIAAQAARAAVPIVEGGMSVRDLHFMEVVATDATTGPCGNVCFNERLRDIARNDVLPELFWQHVGCTASRPVGRGPSPAEGAASVSMTASMVASYEVIFGLQRVRDRRAGRGRATARLLRTGAWPAGEQSFRCEERVGCPGGRCVLDRQRRVGRIALAARERPLVALPRATSATTLDELRRVGAEALRAPARGVEVLLDQGVSPGWRCANCARSSATAVLCRRRIACCRSPSVEFAGRLVRFGEGEAETLGDGVKNTLLATMGFGKSPGWLVRTLEGQAVRVVERDLASAAQQDEDSCL